MYTLRSQPIFNPMQTTLFKRAHTGTCMDNGYDINSMAALSNLFKLNGAQATNDDLIANQTMVSKLVTNTGIPTTLLANQTAANLLDTLQASSSTTTTTNSKQQQTNDNEIFDKLQALSYYQQLNQLNQLQEMPAALFNLQNSSTTFNLARAFQLASELSSSVPFNQQSSTTIQSLIQPTTATSVQSSTTATTTTQTTLTRPAKRQKTIPNPIQLTYSNFNTNHSTNEQVQPLDLSIKSASSTNSERFILETPLNLSRSNSPEDGMKRSSVAVDNSSKIDNQQLTNNLVQIQNALCKKKKIMIQRAAELLKKSSCSSAPCSPSSIATSSSPSDQPFDLDTSQSNQSNLEICLPLSEAVVCHLNNNNKKRKFSDSTFSLDSPSTIHSTTAAAVNSLAQQLPKLQAKRRQAKQRKASVTSEESIVVCTNQQSTPSTIIIDAKNTFTCAICGEMFAFKDRLSKHIKSKHRKTEPIDESKAIAPSQQSNNGGRNSPNQRNYQCTICNRSFSRSDMLTRHSRVHSGLKPYTCNICNSEFTRSDHLATHKRTHSGEKPYKCSKCTYTACRRDMITRHMKTHNNGDKNKLSNSVVLLIPTTKNGHVSSSSPSDHQASGVSSPTTQNSSTTESNQESRNSDSTTKDESEIVV